MVNPFSLEEVQNSIDGVSNSSNHRAYKNEIAFYKDGESEETGHSPAGHIIRKQDNTILISYRGTKNLSEAINDMNTLPSKMQFDTQQVSIHSGFKKEYKKSSKSMIEALNKLDPKMECSITIAGHSMGAAISQIAGLDLKLNHKRNVEKVITFGGPRVFYQEAADLNDSIGPATLKVVRKGDIVTKLPPSPPFASSYSHKVTLKSGSHNSYGHALNDSNINDESIKPSEPKPQFNSVEEYAIATRSIKSEKEWEKLLKTEIKKIRTVTSKLKRALNKVRGIEVGELTENKQSALEILKKDQKPLNYKTTINPTLSYVRSNKKNQSKATTR